MAPLRPREAADELRLMEPVPAWSAEAAGRWDFWGKHPLFSTETQAQCSLLSLSAPQHRAWPGTAQWDALRAQGPPSTASVLSPAMSQPPSKLPTAAVGPQISVWHFQIQSFSQSYLFEVVCAPPCRASLAVTPACLALLMSGPFRKCWKCFQMHPAQPSASAGKEPSPSCLALPWEGAKLGALLLHGSAPNC